MEKVFVGKTEWYWIKEDEKIYKCKYAALHQSMPAVGEVKDVIEYRGHYFVKFGKRFACIG